eukprot:3295359-Amphidinium_carterae.1
MSNTGLLFHLLQHATRTGTRTQTHAQTNIAPSTRGSDQPGQERPIQNGHAYKLEHDDACRRTRYMSANSDVRFGARTAMHA